MTLRAVIVCNALDDVTRQDRGITTDSPAASRKIFMLCQALRMAGVRPFVVSLGRGRAGGNADFFAPVVRRVNGVAVLYAPFSRRKGWSELLSLFAPLGLLRKVRAGGRCHVVFYNRLTAYLPTLVFSALLGNRNFLDLEDGEVASGSNAIQRLLVACVMRIFDKVCSGGALLACSALREYTAIRPTLPYYGTAATDAIHPRFQAPTVSVLMGGTLSPDTGVDMVIAAISSLRNASADWARNLLIHVTGSGPSLAALEALASAPGYPQLIVHGRTTNAQYASILRSCDVGLALKLHTGALADTTFPSKVIEYAAAGMLVLTTDISDVRLVLGQGALYLSQDSGAQLQELLQRAVQDRQAMQNIARIGCDSVQEKCAPRSAGHAVARFLGGDRP
jgi:glycosyltransferase involved in cell wall biosynthesis